MNFYTLSPHGHSLRVVDESGEIVAHVATIAPDLDYATCGPVQVQLSGYLTTHGAQIISDELSQMTGPDTETNR